jgi:hypothetical protein
MNSSKHSMVVGVFDDPHQAELAIAGLQGAGFANEQIALVQQTPTRPIGRVPKVPINRKTHTGALATAVDFVKGLFSSDDDADHYEKEFKAGRTVVTVKDLDKRHDEAMAILKQHGAYNRNTPKAVATVPKVKSKQTSGTSRNKVARPKATRPGR